MKRDNAISGFLMFTVLLMVAVVSGMGGWLLSWQRDQFYLLNCYDKKMYLFVLLEKQVNSFARELASVGTVPVTSQQRNVNGVHMDYQLRCLIDENNRQIWEIVGTASLGAVHVRIVKTVTRARYDDTGQLDTTGEDEGSWYMD